MQKNITSRYATLKISVLFILASFFLFAIKVRAQSQELPGETINALTGLPVPFVSIGIKNKAIGTVSDSLGRYILSYRQDEISKTDSLIFSAIGFHTVKMDLEQFLSGNKTIMLKELPLQLKTVKIKAEVRKMKSYGRWSANLVFFPAMYKTIPKFSDEKGREQATILKIGPDVYLRKLNFGINRRHFKRIKLRLNVYGIKNGIPDHSLLDKDVVFDVSGSSEQGMPKVQTIDLRPYQIEIKGRKEIAVSLSILELQSLPGDTSRQAFFIPSFPNPLRSSLYRMKSEATWQKVSSSHLLIGIEVSTMKTKKVEEEEQKEENLDETTKVDPEISRALYGNNNGKRIKVAGGEIYYETYGKGSPLILLHGNSESISSFRNQIGPLSEHYQVIAMDTRGHGNSINRNTTAYSYWLFADDLKAVMDSIHIQKASLLGWSDGGNTAIEFALKHPEKIDKMVLMGANIFPGTRAIKEDIVRMFEKRRDSLMNLQDAESNNQLRLTQLVLQEPQINADDLGRISMPTLILAGESDVIKTEHTMLIRALIKSSRAEIIAGEDHYLPLKNPGLFNKIVLDFLADKSEVQ
ncbi:pimeloyl-ACP methyl ester carboxylesterase [Pedobacter sp. AK013]|uniref:alpha/beta fold hydrolase n=1 Tax=Pedobacter sp. AK013 TaxID=2723071 RepID=UPI00161707CF|nr:alpha/beta fold hydrolase [Pedobacter sp. AK013]MBB6236919.1 pimeloyl-ACP methyl ester carboxylesterase [Pedobacter sp. AK013]